ncbi:MAG: hypothetical protein FJZ90_04315 [Chloroflexi bacterium]|nr:hypothetical protein [Chloroflexota bacterium]
MELVRAIRNARTEYGVEPGRRIAAIIAAGDQARFLQAQAPVLRSLARIAPDQLEIAGHLAKEPRKALTLVVGGYTCYLPLAALLDLDRERARLGAEVEELERETARVDKLLANQGFVTKAPEAVIQKERDKRGEYAERLQRLKERLAALG